MNLFKVIKIGMFILNWYEDASEDGQITHDEIKEAINGILGTNAIDINIEL
jgi:hypothetical protein